MKGVAKMTEVLSVPLAIHGKCRLLALAHFSLYYGTQQFQPEVKHSFASLNLNPKFFKDSVFPSLETSSFIKADGKKQADGIQAQDKKISCFPTPQGGL